MKMLSLVLACIVLSGCASIVDGGRKSVQIDSEPCGAKFTIYNGKGLAVISTNTPAKIKLKRSQGYFNGEEYKLVFEAPGYYTGETAVTHKIDGWYFGNFVFGGLIGFVAVDPLTGSMWTLSPRKLNYTLLSTNLNLNPPELKTAQLQANLPEKLKTPSTNAPSIKK